MFSTPSLISAVTRVSPGCFDEGTADHLRHAGLEDERTGQTAALPATPVLNLQFDGD